MVFLYQPQSAFNGLLTSILDNELHLLLQARVEPGSIGVTQYGPTIQSTPANYPRVHGGKATPYLELFFQHASQTRPAGQWSQLDLGHRYLFKDKRLVCLEAIEPPPTDQNFIYVPARVIKEAVLEGALLNTDLRSMLAVMAWDQWPRNMHPDELGLGIHASLNRPPRPQLMGLLLAALGRTPVAISFQALDTLESWQLTDLGLFEKEPFAQGFDVEFFRIETSAREVHTWTQPLLNSRSRGKAVLGLSLFEGVTSVLVSVQPERALSSGAAVFPSYVRHPGLTHDPSGTWIYDALVASQTAVISMTVESDEGGRFFRDETNFEVYLISEPIDFGPRHFWITLSELKYLLNCSNFCSLQLRCIASVLLALY